MTTASVTPPPSTPAVENVVVLGTGPAGLTAAIYAARANLQPLIIEGEQPGGQLTITSDVENYPGFAEGVMGPDLMTQFRKQAERFGTRFLTGRVTKVDSSKRPFVLHLDDGKTVKTSTLIIATGASAKWLGIETEKTYYGKGVSACATCDGFFFRNQDIAVVGGGDTAMEEATFLTRFAKSVTVIHRRDSLRASKIMQDKATKNPKIKFVWDTAVEKINGKTAVESLSLKNLKTGATSEMPVTGLFIAIGHEPNTKPFRDILKTDENGYLVVEPGSTKTNVPGIFAAGDVADHVYRQAVTAAGTGCMAAIDAERFLEAEGH
ncbi:MAG: thioredoxin-disulfide reductase [Bdellovibrionales bacterium]|nr:thioredoxin-disulfide reductase [Bdellovibrionales bacterium]